MDRYEYKLVKQTLQAILLKHDFSPEKAELSAWLFAETSLDGVSSHGLNRFPLFIEYIRKGIVMPGNEPVSLIKTRNFERWDGNSGAGNLNAWFCMDRAIQLAHENGTGIVALRNTNHWMRGGSYGLQAAERQCIGICMTNTIPNMPPWGSRQSSIGNNPFVMAVPNEPYPVLLDMAMSQFSYGKLEIMEQEGRHLSQYGGYDRKLVLTKDPALILESGLILPAGYWKGSGMAI